MTRTIKICWLIMMCFAFHSCDSDDQQPPGPDRMSILESPPFRGITDSIRQSPDNIKLLLIRAHRLSGSNQHEVATPDYRKAYELSGDEQVGLEYASNLLMAGDMQEAVSFLEEGSRKFSGSTEYNRRLAEIYLQNGNSRNALEQYERIIRKDSSNFEAWYDRGILLARMYDTLKAIRSLETSFALVPINHTGLALANLYALQKNPKALDIADKLLQRDSTNTATEPLYIKGIYYNETGQKDKAIRIFDEVIRRDWKMTDAYIEKGIIFYERAQYQKALEIFRLTATVSNTDPDAYYWMGRSYEALGEKEEAALNYQRALTLDNFFHEAREALKRLNG